MKYIKFISFILALIMFGSVCLIGCNGDGANYNAAVSLYEEGKYVDAKTAFEAIKDYKDSKDWIKKCKNAISDQAYKSAVALLEGGKIVEGYEALVALGDYKDSVDKTVAYADQYKAEKLKNAKAGDIVSFGHYEQDNDQDNGAEEIQWIVLESKDGKLLLISKYILDYKDVAPKSPWRWQSGAVRKWFNEQFLQSAFTSEEQLLIPSTTLPQDANTQYKALQESFVNNRIFALNVEEVLKYFPKQTDRKCEWTAYAKAESPFPDSEDLYGEWWLRVVNTGGRPYMVNTNGGIESAYGRVEKGLRPAMWIDLNA